MAEAAYAYVSLIPVAKGFQSAVAKELDGVGGPGGVAGKKAGDGFSSGFGSSLKKLAVVAGGALAAAGVGSFLKDSIKQASDLGESVNAVEVVFQGAADGIKKLGETSATALGLSNVEFNAAAVQFSSFATKIAGDGGDVVGAIDELTTRGADFASVMNLEVSDALAIFQSGLAGETEPLKKFGIDLSAAAIEQYALANGIGEAGRALTEQEKVQARYGALMEQTAVTQGDFANTSDSLANSQRILGANFENMQATVGQALVPAFAALTTSLIPVVDQLGPVLTGVMEELSPVVADLAGQIPELLVGFMPLIPVIGQLVSTFLELIVSVLPVLIELIMGILPLLFELVPVFLDLLVDVVQPLIPAFLALVGQMLPIIQEIFPILLGLLASVFPIFLDLLEKVVMPLIPTVMALIEAFMPLLDLVLPILMGLLDNFVIPALEFLAGILETVLPAALGFLTTAFTNFGDFIGDFADGFKEVWTGVKGFFKDTVNNLIGLFEGFVNGAIRGVNSLIGALNTIKFDIPDWVPLIGGKSFGISLPTISQINLPRLAEGGFVDEPTQAIIGEAGPEVVMPLDRFESMLGLTSGKGDSKTVNYYAAPNNSIENEQALFQAMRRAKVVANW